MFYNSKLTKKYIQSIKIIKNENDRIVIVIIDNDSVSQEKINLKEINEKNLGYFSRLNIGLKKIKDKEYDYIIIGNNDIILKRDFLMKLKESKYNKDTLVVCPN